MKSGRWWAAGWAMLGLLIVVGGLMVVGRDEARSRPSALSYSPSGSRALAELLEQSGFKVRIERRTSPALSNRQLAILFQLPQRVNPFQTAEAESISPLRDALHAHLDRGGRALILELPLDFEGATEMAATYERRAVVAAQPDAEPDFNLSAGMYLTDEPRYRPYFDFDEGLTLAHDENMSDLASLANRGQGMAAVVFDATGFTNRFLDQKDNADFAVWLAQFLTPKQGSIVLLEAPFSPAADPGLLALLGDWAVAGWWQIVFCFLVLSYAMGRRFGLPEMETMRQRGSRELVDAQADVMNRAGMAGLALRRVVADADREIRARFGIPSDASPKIRSERLPEELASALSQAEVAAQGRLSPARAVQLVRKLERQIAALKSAPAPRRRKRR